MDKTLKLMFKRIAEISIQLSDERIRVALMERKLKEVIEENDRLQTKILKGKVNA